MKKAAVFLAILMICLCAFMGAETPEAEPIQPVAAAAETFESKDPALEARLMHMLSLNGVFGDEISDKAALLEKTALALKDKAQEDESGFLFIDSKLLESYVFNIYGVSASAAELCYEGFPQIEGKTMIMPRGTESVDHTFVDITEEENGVLRVVSRVKVSPHDGEEYITLAVTRFAPCKASAFGWVIIKAEILA